MAKPVKTTAAKRGRPAAKEAAEPLNFRVPPDFAMAFRIYAVRHRKTQSAVLIEAFDALLRERGESP